MDIRSLNRIGEFADINQEKEFFQQDMKKAVRYVKPVILVLAVLYTLFLIPDYYLVQNSANFRLIAAGRILFLILMLVLYFNTNRIGNYRTLAYWITAYEVVSIVIFLFIFFHYKSPDFLIQAFGVMVIILAVFMVPNRWINMVSTSVFVGTVFVLMSLFYINDLETPKFSAGIVYILIVIILCSITSYRMNYLKRVQFAASMKLIRLSNTDSLTGACNRAKFDEQLKYWVDYSQRYNMPLSLVMFDFDDFKRINDTLGHLVGDSVIVECTSLIKSCVRDSDIFARWGGDEFAILLPNTDRDKAVDLSQRLRQMIEGYNFSDAGHITSSFGATQLHSDEGIESFLQKTDQMLYTAKKAGKNVVIG